MSRNSVSRMSPKSVKGGPRTETLETFIGDIVWHQVPPTNVLALTIWTLKGSAEVIPWSSFHKPSLFLKLIQRCSVKVLGYCNVAWVQLVGREAFSTPSCITPPEATSGHAIVCANNPRPVCDSLLTFETGSGQSPPPSRVQVGGARGILCVRGNINQQQEVRMHCEAIHHYKIQETRCPSPFQTWTAIPPGTIFWVSVLRGCAHMDA
mmetsp:Transcript_35289/g.59917  ORF Transcript_35289/g.59917 Transcript_35289/m.59917 type:complete len:208 (-) Transcript_35289:2370-2993(-)